MDGIPGAPGGAALTTRAPPLVPPSPRTLRPSGRQPEWHSVQTVSPGRLRVRVTVTRTPGRARTGTELKLGHESVQGNSRGQ